MVSPGVTRRIWSVKRLSQRLASLLETYQAMCMAMTTVLPLPVTNLKATR